MPTWVHYCFCLIMQLVYIPAEAPPSDCGSFLIGRTFFVNMYAYVFMAFLLSISGMFICDRHFQNIKNCSVNENFNSKHQMPFSNSIFMSPCIIKNRPFYSMSLDLTPQELKVNDAFSPISSSCDISYILKISSEFHKFSQI